MGICDEKDKGKALAETHEMEYFAAEFSNGEEAEHYLGSFRYTRGGKFHNDLYACLYIDGEFKDEHT